MINTISLRMARFSKNVRKISTMSSSMNYTQIPFFNEIPEELIYESPELGSFDKNLIRKPDISEERLENTPSCFVSDKCGLFQIQKQESSEQEGWVNLTLAERIPMTDDTYLFRFSFPQEHEDVHLGSNVCGTVMFRANIETEECPEGEVIERKYTVTSAIDQKGHIDIPIKIYRPDRKTGFSQGGIMTTYLENLPIGSTIEVGDKSRRIHYYGNGFIKSGDKIVKKDKIAFVAGGSGITPYYRIIKEALENGDSTHFTLIYANRTEDDVIYKEELEELASIYPHKFTYKQVISSPKNMENLQGVHIGHINEDLLSEYLPAPGDDLMMDKMGPKGMRDAFDEIISNLGYNMETMVRQKPCKH